MRYNVTVSVPYSKRLPYTLFAKGSLAETPHLKSEGNLDFVQFKFFGGTVFVLFYTFKGFRRAYIATGWQDKKDGEPIELPGVDESLCLIFTARGKRIDHLKRVLQILTTEQKNEHKVFSLPLLFWYRLAALIQFDGAHRSDVMLLYENFTERRSRK